MKQAIMELQSEKHLKTIDEEAALQLDHNDKSLFVFSNFSTPAFHHCKKLGCRVVSTLVVHFCLQHQRCVPKAEQPVYNMAMADITISCTSLDKEARVVWCWTSSALTPAAPTSLRRNEKYLAAMAVGKWILHRSYLEACRSVGHFIQVTIWPLVHQTTTCQYFFHMLLGPACFIKP
ncbi:DNA topoisomerase 2-binding protein 1-like isoform X1 [Oncorhynchus mykiss]|uniref:DNA topoisomerase 2-binding protein 1-like isoform X1 n=1 Tax=Oncorhynchus mykiss TaxID=8022 RepID=UPI0018777530|nr:DNA topoisomerase 2-binding protein 1-like isoform X1 [Oncorhynchus mykiss]